MTALVARWRPAHVHDAALLTTHAEIDAMLATLLGEAVGRIAVELRVEPPAPGDQRRMLVGVNANELTGSVALLTDDESTGDPTVRRWYGAGKAYLDGGRVAYPWMGQARWFPPDCRLSLDEISAAVKDWLVTAGRRRPAAITWQPWPARDSVEGSA